jgi:hypothetical protein
MTTPSAACPQCAESAGSGRIFCANCGAAIQAVSLLPSDRTPDNPAARVSVLKGAAILIIKAIGAIAALIFAFSRFTTNTGILLFGASIVVGLLCIAALSYLDDDFLKEHMNEGYWPSKPIDWGAARNDSTGEKRTDKSIFQ